MLCQCCVLFVGKNGSNNCKDQASVTLCLRSSNCILAMSGQTYVGWDICWVGHCQVRHVGSQICWVRPMSGQTYVG